MLGVRKREWVWWQDSPCSRLTFFFNSLANPSRGNRKVGILLMDHGSRNEASNSRLKRLAELYGTMMSDENVVVVAAHMELANPSIPEGLEILMEQGVGKCVL